MTNFNCPKCQIKSTFVTVENRFKCDRCKNSFRKCKINECSSLTRYGVICKNCTGKGFRKGGSAAAAIIALGLATAAKGFKK